MLNIDKVFLLLEQRGIKKSAFANQLGVNQTYLYDVKRGKSSMSKEQINATARILDTTYEYLTDQTDDPTSRRSTSNNINRPLINISKVRKLCKEKGIKMSYICDQFGLCRSYINDVANGKNTMSDTRIYVVAEILGTTYEYLTDQTENHEANESTEKTTKMKLLLAFGEQIHSLSDTEAELLLSAFSKSDDSLKRFLSALASILDH